MLFFYVIFDELIHQITVLINFCLPFGVGLFSCVCTSTLQAIILDTRRKIPCILYLHGYMHKKDKIYSIRLSNIHIYISCKEFQYKNEGNIR